MSGRVGRPPRDLAAEPPFGRLTALRCVGRDRHGNAAWECRCACENTRVVRQSSLVNGRARSCGCLARERFAARNAQRTATSGVSRVALVAVRLLRALEARAPNGAYVTDLRRELGATPWQFVAAVRALRAAGEQIQKTRSDQHTHVALATRKAA